MTTERMLELIILNKFMDRYNNMPPQAKALICEKICISKVDERILMLGEEFLAPYEIDNTSREG